MRNNGLQAAKHEDFANVLDRLLENLFLADMASQDSLNAINDEEIRRATWLASIAALGAGDYEKNLANSYGALLHLSNPENEIYKRACYVLQSRTGNLITSQHIPKLFNGEKHVGDYGTILNYELTANRALLEHSFSDESKIYFTSFQKLLWESLVDGKNIAISAPTSAGKSHIIKKYIYELISKKSCNIVFIVPTKALINQVSSNLKSELKDKAHVLTTYIPIELSEGISSVYVLTPERCLKLLQDKELIQPDLVFIDEVHNIESGARGTKFENIIYSLISRFKSTQFVMAGPFINELSNSLKAICDISLIDHQTLSTPVFQLKTALTFFPKSREVTYKIISPTENLIEGKIKLKKSLFSKIKTNKGDALEFIAGLFHHNDLNIYYSPNKSSAEKWASKIAPTIASNNPDIIDAADERIKELISFLEDEVHPSYSLIRTLRLGVAFHHAGLPDIARQEVEELYSSSAIKNIVCTSTLLQGVNLPADRLIVISPKVSRQEMKDFDFLNLIGRAGRANTKLFGEIYCIDVKNEEWAEDRLTNKVAKTVKASSSIFLKEYEVVLDKIADLSRTELKEITEDKDAHENISYMRSLFHTDNAHFNKLLSSSGISEEASTKFVSKLEDIYSGIRIPSELISKNPFIDPLLQNKLFTDIEKNGLNMWLFSRLPIHKGGENDENAAFEEQSYYRQFESIFIRLNDIFEIEDEINYQSFNDYVGIRKLVLDCHRWMQGKKHRFFIDKVIGESSRDEKQVDKAARNITNHISRNITFIAVKYLMVWSDIVSHFLTEEQREENSYILNLPSMLEMGSYDPKILELMSFGINRSVAFAISKDIKKLDMSVEDALSKIDKTSLPNIFGRYLKKAGY